MDLDNICCHNGKWLEISYVQAFFTLYSQRSLCESCSTSQILLAYSGSHPPKTMSPNSWSDFSSSSLDPSNHSLPTIIPNPLAATPDPVPQPPPYISFSLPLSEGSSQFPSPAFACNKLWDLSPTLYPEGPKALPRPPKSLPHSQSWTTLKQETSPQDPALSPDPLLPLGEVAGVEGIDRVHVPFSLTICLRLKSILAPSPHTWIIILKNLGVLKVT